MDRLVRARVLWAEAAALGVTIEDLIAESSGASSCPSTAPTVAEYVDTVSASFSKGTAGTYKSYRRLAIDRLGERTIDSIGVDDCESVVADAVNRARGKRPGTDGRSARASGSGGPEPGRRAGKAATPPQSPSCPRRWCAARGHRGCPDHQSGFRPR